MAENGLLEDIKLIVGTSIGGLNALFFAKYLHSFGGVLNVWQRIRKDSDVFTGKIDFFGVLGMLTGKGNSCGGKSIVNPIGRDKILEDEFGDSLLKDLPVEVCITGTNLTYQKREVYYPQVNKEFKCVDVAKITSSFPVIFPAQEIKDVLYTDGGVLNNTPVETAIELGATEIWVVGTHPFSDDYKKLKNNWWNVLKSMGQTLLAGYEKEMWEDIQEKYPSVIIHKLYPQDFLGNLMKFDRNEEKIAKGYITAKKYWG